MLNRRGVNQQLAPRDWSTRMTMKAHILTALREPFTRWDDLLAKLSAEQITAPQFADHWSIKDVIAHLWA